MFKFGCYILNVCKWLDKEWPAVKSPRAIIDKDGGITPCFDGQPIAKVNDGYGKAIKTLRLLWFDGDLYRKLKVDKITLMLDNELALVKTGKGEHI